MELSNHDRQHIFGYANSTGTKTLTSFLNRIAQRYAEFVPTGDMQDDLAMFWRLLGAPEDRINDVLVAEFHHHGANTLSQVRETRTTIVGELQRVVLGGQPRYAQLKQWTPGQRDALIKLLNAQIAALDRIVAA